MTSMTLKKKLPGISIAVILSVRNASLSYTKRKSFQIVQPADLSMTLRSSRTCSAKILLYFSQPATRRKSDVITNFVPCMTNPSNFIVRLMTNISASSVQLSTQDIDLLSKTKTSLWLRRNYPRKLKDLIKIGRPLSDTNQTTPM